MKTNDVIQVIEGTQVIMRRNDRQQVAHVLGAQQVGDEIRLFYRRGNNAIRMSLGTFEELMKSSVAEQDGWQYIVFEYSPALRKMKQA